jgi:hypothetical protein
MISSIYNSKKDQYAVVAVNQKGTNSAMPRPSPYQLLMIVVLLVALCALCRHPDLGGELLEVHVRNLLFKC